MMFGHIYAFIYKHNKNCENHKEIYRKSVDHDDRVIMSKYGKQ